MLDNFFKCYIPNMCDRVVSLQEDCFKLLEDPVRTTTKLGIHEFVAETLTQYPQLIWSSDDENRHTIFHIAVLHRHEKIFSLVGKLFTHKHPTASLRDKEGNNILYLAARLGPCSEVPGAALHMQHELKWFKEMEKCVLTSYKRKMNKSDKTPRMVFSEEHKELVAKRGQWIQSTATARSIVACSLIITTLFPIALALSLCSSNGSTSFLVFLVTVTLSLCSSMDAALMFPGIITSRSSEDDFHKSLPHNLIIGLVSLFISIVAMPVAVGALFFILLIDLLGWFCVIPIGIGACLHIVIFLKT